MASQSRWIHLPRELLTSSARGLSSDLVSCFFNWSHGSTLTRFHRRKFSYLAPLMHLPSSAASLHQLSTPRVICSVKSFALRCPDLFVSPCSLCQWCLWMSMVPVPVDEVSAGYPVHLHSSVPQYVGDLNPSRRRKSIAQYMDVFAVAQHPSPQ